MIVHRLEGVTQSIGCGAVRRQTNRGETSLDVQRQSLGTGSGVVRTDNAIKTLLNRSGGRFDTDDGICCIVNRNDDDLLAVNAALGIELIGRQLGTVDHAFASIGLVARNGCFHTNADSAGQRGGSSGIGIT
ncbi:unannotated protein [freshwater metagenome]|uniref:Unannotated protein n=1 Tax=freshwater metagenome TaxID=449393 RepID=A0A6J6Y4U3_9ZZZZ